MKTLVFLLVLANLLFYAFGAGYFGQGNPDAGRMAQQINPERIRIISNGEPPASGGGAPTASPAAAPTDEAASGAELAAPGTEPAGATPPAADPTASEIAETALRATPGATPKVTLTCLFWRPLTVVEADRLAELLTQRFADYTPVRRVIGSDGNGWWVHIPALPSRADAERKAGELRGLGIDDFFIVQDGQSRNAISLGVFSTESRGRDKLAELKGKGVRSAVLAPRPGKDDSLALEARGPASAREALLGAARELLPRKEAQACP